MFSEEKVAQMAAYLLLKRGGRMAYLKLMKLLYLSNRRSILERGRMMGEDNLYSMPHGPVMSHTLDLIRQRNRAGGKYWFSLLQTEGTDLVLRRDPRTVDVDDVLDTLSRSDLKILDGVYAEFGHMNRFDLRDMTHLEKYCPEWRNPGSSRMPIDCKDILIYEGKSEEDANNIIQNMRESEDLKEFNTHLI
ncbi:Panacea domain-containing protein [Rahnella contaminans]|uniref:Panacea domain-containing protein n=1 Tax=Rahnella contaminans TaxID=2703882 RepID=UPI0023DBF47E|nr:Panacea domain-containing protein [Rahnella contaminans]MDF1895075.1 Panacea domain-containing protein [Rahnella contaminans]